MRRYVEKKAKERKLKLLEIRKKALKELEDKNELPLNSIVLLSEETRDKDCTMLLTCIYRYNGEKGKFKTGFLWATVTATNRIKPFILWDKYGKYITNKEIVKNYTMYCVVPPLSDNIYCVLSSYIVALQYAHFIAGDNLDSELLDTRDVKLQRHDSDLVLAVRHNTDNADGDTIGFITKEGNLDGLFIDVMDSKKLYKIDGNVDEIELKDILELLEGTFAELKDTQLDSNCSLVVNMVTDKLKSVKCVVKDCNIFHLLLLIDGSIKIRVTYVDDDEVVEGKTKCKLLNQDITPCKSDQSAMRDDVNHLVMNLFDLNLCYHDRRVKIDLDGVDEERKQKLLEDLALNGKATLKF